ncbi:MAG: hypothetical protein DI551_02850 [Micavibrio aeruginosavorus]|uniref:Uncharacterized protein n=1 Tax=Micavibrio aeruginosavorus TaxID=349221 RepID=A0A2W5N531_9BACT|nr:MAG: hypothetical protein DI551_02850 [Micavibrio aeruginosavorus]
MLGIKRTRKEMPPLSGEKKLAPVFAQAYQKDYLYVFPRSGPVICNGVKNIDISGRKVPLMDFEDYFEPLKTRQVPEGRVERSGARHVMNYREMNYLFSRMANPSKADKAGLPPIPSKQQDFFNALLQSNSPEALLKIVHTSYGRAAEHPMGGHAIEFGDIALDLLSKEFAVVKGVELELAQALFDKRSGKAAWLRKETAHEAEKAENAKPKAVKPRGRPKKADAPKVLPK